MSETLVNFFIFLSVFLVILPLNEFAKALAAAVLGVPVLGFNIGLGQVKQTFFIKSCPVHFRHWPFAINCKLPLTRSIDGTFRPDLEFASRSPEEEERVQALSTKLAHLPTPVRFFLPSFMGPSLTLCVGIAIVTVTFRYGTTLKGYSNPSVIGKVPTFSREASAGLRSGDRILKVDGEDVATYIDFASTNKAAFNLKKERSVLLQRASTVSGPEQQLTLTLPVPNNVRTTVSPTRIPLTPTWGDAVYLAFITLNGSLSYLLGE